LGFTPPFVRLNGIEDTSVTWRRFSDRFSLAILSAEFLVVGRGSPLTNDGGVFKQSEIYNRGGAGISKIIGILQREFPKAVGLLEQALRAASFDSCPTWEDWTGFCGVIPSGLPVASARSSGSAAAGMAPIASTKAVSQPLRIRGRGVAGGISGKGVSATVLGSRTIGSPAQSSMTRIGASKWVYGLAAIMFLLIAALVLRATISNSPKEQPRERNTSTGVGPQPQGRPSPSSMPLIPQTPTSPNPSDGPAEPGPSKEAAFVISSNLDGVDLFIDGVSRGVLLAGHEKTLRLPSGVHDVSAQKAGYNPWKKRLKVMGDSRLSIDMEPIPPKPQEIAKGYLERIDGLTAQRLYGPALDLCNEGLSVVPGNPDLLRKKSAVERIIIESKAKIAGTRPSPTPTPEERPPVTVPTPRRPVVPTYEGPSSGMIKRLVDLDANASVSIGSELPGVPVLIDVDPRDKLAIEEPPGPSNYWKKLTLRSRSKLHTMITVRWRILPQ
jgi:hypothetical protein